LTQAGPAGVNNTGSLVQADGAVCRAGSFRGAVGPAPAPAVPQAGPCPPPGAV